LSHIHTTKKKRRTFDQFLFEPYWRGKMQRWMPNSSEEEEYGSPESLSSSSASSSFPNPDEPAAVAF
jgi:hypothetical protein